MLAAKIHHLAIDVNHGHHLDTAMPEDLARCRTFAAAENKDCPRLWMSDEGRVNKSFVINEFVRLRGLHFTIEDEAPAERVGIGDDRALIARPLLHNHAFYAVKVGFVRRDAVSKPGGWRHGRRVRSRARQARRRFGWGGSMPRFTSVAVYFFALKCFARKS